MKTSLSYLFKSTYVVIIFITYTLQISAQIAEDEEKFLGNIYYQGQTPVNFDHYWNQITPENAGKWASCEQNRDDFNYWLWLDRAYNHAKTNDYPFKQHTMVWGHSSGEPDWISGVPQEEQYDEVVEWYQAFAERYPDVDMIDVVNEPIHDPPSYADAMGGAGETGWDWVITSFELAREFFPDAELILNDYNILNYSNETQQFLEVVDVLQSRGLIDAIGCESHSLESVALNTIEQNLNDLAATGLPIYISELDLRGDDQTQLQLYQDIFPLFWEHPSVKGVTLWGYIDGEMWRNQAHLIRSDGTERPALQWLKEYFGYTEEPGPYSITTDTTGPGTISLNPSGGSYEAGTEVTITATPEDGYEFVNWSGDIGGSSNPATVLMTSNRSVTAHFESIGDEGQYVLNTSTMGPGSISLDPPSENGAYDEGTVVTITANPSGGYIFDSWSGDLSGQTNPETITLDDNYSIIANFTQDPNDECETDAPVTLPFVQDGEGVYC